MGVGTSHFIYEISNLAYVEYLFMEVEVAPDGGVTGKGSWWLSIQYTGSYVGEGIVDGSLDAGLLTGEGILVIAEEGGNLEIPWTISKDVP